MNLKDLLKAAEEAKRIKEHLSTSEADKALIKQIKEEERINKLNSLDSTVERTIFKQAENLGKLFQDANISAVETVLEATKAARQSMLDGVGSQLEMQRQEMLERINQSIKPSFDLDKIAHELIGKISQQESSIYRHFQDMTRSINEDYSHLTENRQEHFLTPIYKAPPVVQMPNPVPRNFAEEWIRALDEEIQSRRETLEIDQALRVYLAFGSREILITECNAKDNVNVEIKGLDGEDIVSVVAAYNTIQLLFKIVPIPKSDKNEILH